jgi:formate hydrogenlyase transcriptional activator
MSPPNQSGPADLQLLIDSIPALIHTSQPDGYLDYFNERWREYIGVPLEEIAGWKWKAFVHPEDVDAIVKKWRACLASGEVFEHECRVRRADGKYRWMAHTKVPLRDASGKIVKWYGSSIDIDDRRQADQSLRRSEFYLGEGQRLAHMGSWAFNPAGFFDYWSPELFRIYGLDPSQGPPTLAEYLAKIHPQDRDFMARTIERMLADASGCDVKKRIMGPGGAIRHVRCVGVPVLDQGIFKGVVGTAVDVTEQEELTEQLRRRQAYLAEAQKLSHTGSFGWNVESGQIFWSDETFRIFECDRETTPTLELILQRTHPEDRVLVQELIDRASHDGKYFNFEHRLLFPNGSVKNVHIVAHALRGESGLEFVGSVMDVTAGKQATAALEKAFKEIETLKDQLYKENIALREEIDKASMFEEIVGSSEALRKVLLQVVRVAPTDSTVLILGETGTGKELIARAIHSRSNRSTRAFIRVNCAAIPSSLVASELFGHEKGAFTGASQRRVGRFESADGGTIFLDEVGDLPMDTQVALLRVLQEREFERVGGTESIAVNVRVLAATNRDLRAAVAAGSFRQDLFYRLNVFPIQVPSLRERREDIPLLVQYLIDRYGKKAGKKIRNIAKEALDLFQAYDWPGNIRELQNVVERAVIFCDGETFSVDRTWLEREVPQSRGPSVPLVAELVEREKEVIESALAECNGRISGPSGAAARLGIPRQTLEWKIAKLRIDRYRFKPNRVRSA